jgi:hypothetical protein
MPRPVVGLSKHTFEEDKLEDFYIYGQNLKQNGDVPSARIRSKRHYWKNVQVVDDTTSTNTVLHLKGKPKRKNGAFFVPAPAPGAAPAPGYDGYDDLTITLTWDEETGDELTQSLTYEDIEYTSPPPP